MLELEVDGESEEEAAELLLKSLYSTVNASVPLHGASQAMLLQLKPMFLKRLLHASCFPALVFVRAAPQRGISASLSGQTLLRNNLTGRCCHFCMPCFNTHLSSKCCFLRTG